jgi:hypothetical protein
MPPRYVYWTILIDGAVTSFRAATPEELLPTLKQLQRKTPGAVMKWFARGRVWNSPEEERAATLAALQLRRMAEKRGPHRSVSGTGGRWPQRDRDRAPISRDRRSTAWSRPVDEEAGPAGRPRAAKGRYPGKRSMRPSNQKAFGPRYRGHDKKHGKKGT